MWIILCARGMSLANFKHCPPALRAGENSDFAACWLHSIDHLMLPCLKNDEKSAFLTLILSTLANYVCQQPVYERETYFSKINFCLFLGFLCKIKKYLDLVGSNIYYKGIVVRLTHLNKFKFLFYCVCKIFPELSKLG